MPPTPTKLDINAQFPPKTAPLFQPKRYKILVGGRGSGKSWACARAILLLGQQKRIRVLCCREFMTSIADSIHQLLSDQARELGLGDFYLIEQKRILGQNGTEIRFAGLKTNPSAIRSFEAVDICFCEEAQSISKGSWETLIPTIRAPGSEIWIAMNPELETDNSYQRWIMNPPKNAWVCMINYMDNPWFPEVLREEMEELKAHNYHDYLHVYEGHCRQFLDGAVYYDQITFAEKEGRITRVPYDPMAPVEVFIDLGWADATAMWFAQKIPGGETHLIDYFEGTRRVMDFYLQMLSNKPYPIHTIWLPHDAKAKNLGTGRSIEELVRAKGFNVRMVPMLSLNDGINALRSLFSNLWIDRGKCEDGLQSLRHYRYELTSDGSGGFKNAPVHDRWSHGADCARYMAIALRQPKKHSDLKYEHRPFFPGQQTSWMQL